MLHREMLPQQNKNLVDTTPFQPSRHGKPSPQKGESSETSFSSPVTVQPGCREPSWQQAKEELAKQLQQGVNGWEDMRTQPANDSKPVTHVITIRTPRASPKGKVIQKNGLALTTSHPATVCPVPVATLQREVSHPGLLNCHSTTQKKSDQTYQKTRPRETSLGDPNIETLSLQHNLFKWRKAFF